MFYAANDYSSDDDNRFHAVYHCYSPAFLTDREQTIIEHGGKILLPQTALEQLIDQVKLQLVIDTFE